ncbi:MAG: class I SAM-dependent methyltransferase [Anaerolineae bacterium]
MIQTAIKHSFLEMLRCPVSGEPLHQEEDWLVSQSGQHRYRLNSEGIPLFAEQFISKEGRAQQEHYDKVAAAYLENLTYPHTQEYMAYLDRVFLDQVGNTPIGSVAEVCCGRGEAFLLIGDRVQTGVGIDVSVSMLRAARKTFADEKFFFAQGDATMMPIEDNQLDAVVMLGGIHHVNDREKLFNRIYRILFPGGKFYWREPVSELAASYGAAFVLLSIDLSSHLINTERPLVYEETVPPLEKAGFRVRIWQTYGFLGFCFFMNSDVLVFNRLFRYIRHYIRAITRFFYSSG